MERMFFNLQATHHRWIGFIIAIFSSLVMWGQSGTNKAVEELVNHGFENVRWIENDNECIYTIENNVYRAQGVGIAQALDIIQKHGLPTEKRCKIIVTHLEVPELSLTYHPNECDTIGVADKRRWETSYEVGDSWDSIKKEKAKNSSRFKVDILVYPQLSFKNLIITQIYQVLFTLNPAIEVSLWPGMKLTGQVIIPVYNDGYGYLQDKVHPGFITLSQRFRLPYNIKGKATIGYFSTDRYGPQALSSFLILSFFLLSFLAFLPIFRCYRLHLSYAERRFLEWLLTLLERRGSCRFMQLPNDIQIYICFCGKQMLF